MAHVFGKNTVGIADTAPLISGVRPKSQEKKEGACCAAGVVTTTIAYFDVSDTNFGNDRKN